MEKKLNLTRQEKSWVAYDAGNSAFTMLISSIFPIYFAGLASKSGVSAQTSTAWWGYALAISTLVIALLSPIFGTMADYQGMKKKFFTYTWMMGVVSAAALGLVNGWVTFIILFIVAKIGYNGSLVFYDAMLTDVSEEERMDMVSSFGYAIGYISSCIPFALSILIIQTTSLTGLSETTAAKIAFLLTAVWWAMLTIPLLKNYRQQYFIARQKKPWRASVGRLKENLRSIRSQKHIFLFMLAFFFYIDGVYTIIGMAASYGNAVGIDTTSMILALLLTQIIAFPFAILFGKIATRFHPRKLIEVCVGGYLFISLFAIQLDRAWEFWLLAVLVAMFQGGIQALSRSYFAKLIPKERANEYFGIFDIFGKYADFLGPLMMGLMIDVTGRNELGVASISILFVVGWVLLRRLGKYEANRKGILAENENQ